jgi:hypothetical protein
MEQLGSQWTDFYKIQYITIFRKSFENIQDLVRSHFKTDTLYEEIRTAMITSCPVLLRMRNVSDESCRENQNTFCIQ